jgi:pyridine nucleotide-disulfide oxidoreductase family protein
MSTLVLAGAGHVHAQVLLEFGRCRPPGLKDIIVVAPHVMAPYSGMVPGWIAGHYRWNECCIDFQRLCRHAGASLIEENVAGIDADSSSLVLGSGRRLHYDWLSLNVGSTLKPDARDSMVLPLRPLADLRDKWPALMARLKSLAPGQRFCMVTAGGGAAGVETVLAAQHAIQAAAPHVQANFILATSGKHLVPGLSAAAERRLQICLDQAGVQVLFGFRATAVTGNVIFSEDGRSIACDAVLWATGAQAHDWLAASALATDERGFVQVDNTLRSVSHPRVFASGDCAGWSTALPKAGVFAVRMGPVLARNLYAAVASEKLSGFKPQRRYLVLIGSGGAQAVASWGSLGWQGRAAWWWKQTIDRRFLQRYAV